MLKAVLLDQLSEFLMVEQGGLQLYRTAAARATDPELKAKYVEFGRAHLRGEPLDLVRPDAAGRRGQGIAHVPEDRHRRGLVMPFAEWENACFGHHREPRFQGRWWTMNRRRVRDAARAGIERFDIRPPSCDLATANFSGGNQQKIVLSREIERDPEVLLVGQPTRGVDVGAIEFIHAQIIALRDRGKAILLVSVELDEIQALSDRILVMFDGRISGERRAEETEERELGLLMAGIEPVAQAAS